MAGSHVTESGWRHRSRMAHLSTLVLLAAALSILSCTEPGPATPKKRAANSASLKSPTASAKQHRKADTSHAATPSDDFPLPPDSLYHVALPKRFTADRILVEKSRRRLTLMKEGRAVKYYRVALGTQPVGPKRQEGDRKTPEGIYTIDRHNPASDWYYSLHISYPSAADRARARRMGVSPGGDVMIHGLAPRYAHWGMEHARSDWTWGCIALSNPEMDELRRSIPPGTTIEIRP